MSIRSPLERSKRKTAEINVHNIETELKQLTAHLKIRSGAENVPVAVAAGAAAAAVVVGQF